MKLNFTQVLAVLSALLVAVLGHPDTAQAQNGIAFSPNPVTFASSLNNTSAQGKDVAITVNGVPAVSPTGTPNPPGIFSSAPSVTPGSLTIIANPAGLQPGTYTTNFAISANGVTGNLPVTLTVYGFNTITLSPNTLTFNAATNGPPAQSQTVSVTGSVPGIPFNITTATTTGGNWLTASQTGTTVPASIVVSANPGTLAPGTYTGTVTVTSDQIAPQTIAVTLVVSGQPIFVVTPNPIQLQYQTGVGLPAPTVNVSVASTSAPLNYSGSVNFTTCPNFFNVTSGLSGTTNSTLVVTANLAAIGSATSCSGSIVFTVPGAQNSTASVPVTFQSSNLPLLSVNPTFVTFNYSVGGTVPTPQSFTVSSTGTTSLSFGVSSNSPWLMVPATPPNGFPTPSTIPLTLNQAALQTMNPGFYQATVTITALGAGNSPLTFTANLTISNTALVTVSQNVVNFNYQTGQQIPNALSVNVASTMGSVPFTVAVPTTTTTQFIAFTPASGTATTTPVPLSLALIPSALVNLSPGVYQNQVVISGGGASQTVQATLTVSNSPLVNVSPQQLVFTYALNGQAPPQQTLNVSSTNNSSLPVTFSSNQPYLLVPGNVNTPSSVQVAVQPSGLAVGTYNAQITIASGSQVQTVPVTINVTSGVTVTATPATLTFAQTAGGTAPTAQTVTVAAAGSTTAQAYSASATTNTGGNWLSITGNANGVFQGTAPGTFSVVANGAGLAPGTYMGSVVITSVGASNPSLTIPVTLTVTAQTLAAAPASLTFSATVQGAAPPTQSINVTSTSIGQVAFNATAQTTSGGNWLSVNPATGTTPQSVTVSVNQAGLAAGTYNGSVTFTSTASGSVGLVVPVTLTVGAQATPSVSQVQNAGSFATGPIAPGEIISLFGNNLGPVTPASLTLTPQGSVSTNLGNVQVLFDGIPAPLTYVSATQINAVVPYEVFGRATTNVVVNFNGLNTAGLQLNVAASAPGIFSLGGTQAAVLNQNNSVNGANNAAAKGSTIVIYATGEGQTTPLGVTGSIATTLKNPMGAVSVTIGGQPATVAYAGSAPSLVSGVFQLNVVVPANAPSGSAVPVVVTVGTASSQPNSTVAIQ